MKDRKNSLMVFLIIFFLLLSGSVFVLNRWVTQQVEETEELKKGAPVVVPTARNRQQRPPVNPYEQKVSQPPVSPETVSPAESQDEKKEEDKKIIYELPLDDVILIQ